jgi:hypothetical protein
VTFKWETRPVSGLAPTPRGSHSAVLHDHRLFVFGGSNGQEVFSDLHILDLASSAYLPLVPFSLGA